MKRELMDRTLADELAHIGTDNREQRILRAVYNMQRRSDLGRDAKTPRRESLAEAIRIARKDSPSFEPAFDEAYFSL